MDRGSLACGMSPRQGLRPNSPNTSSVNRRVSRYFDNFDILQAGSRGLWYHSSQRPKSRASPSKFNVSINRADNKRESNRAFKLIATPSLFQSENQSQYTTQKNWKNISCKICNTPAPIAPRRRENPQNSQYSKPTLKTETRKKIEKRAKMKE